MCPSVLPTASACPTLPPAVICVSPAPGAAAASIEPAIVTVGGAAPVFGQCPQNLTQKQQELPPLPVDLILKSFSGHARFLAPLFASISLFWRDYASLVLVLDSPDEAWALSLAPPRTVWIVEPQQATGYFGQMLSNLFADAYTLAPVLAIMDSDTTLQLRVDRASLTTSDDRLVLRYLTCNRPPRTDIPPSWPRATPSPGTAQPAAPPEGVGTAEERATWATIEADTGCLYADATEFLIGAPYVGNFMVQSPLLLPRIALPALRAHVEALHKKPFLEVMQQVAGMGDGKFSQHGAIGNFLFHFGGSVRAALDGSRAVGGLRGLAFVAWGREPQFPHIGRHLGWEWVPNGPDTSKGNLKSPERGAEYLPYALDVSRVGVCRSYANADPALCAHARGPPRSPLPDVDPLLKWQIWGPGPGQDGPIEAGPYAAAVRKTCHAA